MPEVARKPQKEWISGRTARSMCGGLTWNEMLRLAASGKVRTLALPGVAMKFLYEDVHNLSEEIKAAAKGELRAAVTK